jgi:transcriptional regulator with XRE-family HTH domain
MAPMPISTAEKVTSLANYLGSQRRLAEALGVDPAQVSRWHKGQAPDLRNAERVDVLELVLSELSRLYEPEVALRWLWGLNPHLGDRRPIEVVRAGQPEELVTALRMELAGSPA